MPRNVGKHAAGIVIAPGDIHDYIPLYRVEESDEVVTQYDKDDIDIVKFSIRIGGTDQFDENRILLDPTVDIKRNLSPFESSEVSIYEPNKFDEKLRYHTSKLQITRSPQKILNDFIIDNLADFDISEKYHPCT